MKKFNIFHTFFPAAPILGASCGYAWVQVIDGKPLAVFTRAEFKRELRLIARSL